MHMKDSLSQAGFKGVTKCSRFEHDSIAAYKECNLRGVSKNGRCNWQILSMSNGAKFYLGTVDNILKAAILYDIFCLQTKGLKAKTNFNYTRHELIAIYNS